MAVTVDELKKKLAEEEKGLRDYYAKKIEVARKKIARSKRIEEKKARAVVNHGKYIFAGYILAEMKKTKDTKALEKCLATLTQERDKIAVGALLSAMDQKGPAPKPS